MHSLHGQSLGLQFFILFLKTAREADSFISFGTCDQIFGTRYVKDLIPYRWVYIGLGLISISYQSQVLRVEIEIIAAIFQGHLKHQVNF